MFPNGSITDAVTNPGPRSTGSSWIVAPRDTSRSTLARTPAVDDAELVLVVTDAELNIRGRSPVRAHEVRIDAEQLGVPVLGGRDVVGEEADGGESSQHLCFLPWSVTATILWPKVLAN
jgi:hypothetical protein